MHVLTQGKVHVFAKLATSFANFLLNIEAFFFALHRFIRGERNLVTVKNLSDQAIVMRG